MSRPEQMESVDVRFVAEVLFSKEFAVSGFNKAAVLPLLAFTWARVPVQSFIFFEMSRRDTLDPLCG